MQKLRELVESTSVAIVLLVVFLPVRVLFVRYVSDDWFGSFGLITLVSIIILVMAKKDKLGWFGRAYHRQLYKANRGRRRYFLYFNLTLGLIFFVATIYAINTGSTDYQMEVEQLKTQLPYDDLEEMAEVSKDQIEIKDLPLAIYVFLYIVVLRFDIFTIIMTTLNDFSDGWVLHFSTVLLVEELEIIGLLVFYRFTVKKET